MEKLTLAPPSDLIISEQNPQKIVDDFEVHGTDLADIDGFFESAALRCGFPTLETHQYLREAQPDLVVVAARPGAGKTAFACQIALEVAKDGPVQLFSLEMTKEQLASRIFSVVSKIPIKELYRLNEVQRAHLRHQLRSNSLKIDDKNGLSINELIVRATDIHNRTPLRLIVVDYLQIVTTQSGRSKAEEVLYISEKLKGLAKKLSVPILALAQMNRMFDGRISDNPMAQPVMSDLADSSGIEKWADVILCLHRSKDFPNIVKGFVLKNRNGVALDFDMRFNGETTRFSDGESI